MSAVTAVPLRPLAKGSVLKFWLAVGLLVLVAAGLGWWGTSGLQRTAMPNGVSYQVIREGSGELISSADIAAINFVGAAPEWRGFRRYPPRPPGGDDHGYYPGPRPRRRPQADAQGLHLPLLGAAQRLARAGAAERGARSK